jgi:hypothetical protein
MYLFATAMVSMILSLMCYMEHSGTQWSGSDEYVASLTIVQKESKIFSTGYLHREENSQ